MLLPDSDSAGRDQDMVWVQFDVEMIDAEPTDESPFGSDFIDRVDCGVRDQG